jgi:aldehyde:ferredoxin oxidoreductase
MGDKKLKAVVVQPGTQKIPIANPDDLIMASKMAADSVTPGGKYEQQLLFDHDNFQSRQLSCAWGSCQASIASCPLSGGNGVGYYNKVPTKYTGGGTTSYLCFCASGGVTRWMEADRGVRVEMGAWTADLGLNHWELFTPGISAFMWNCYNAGKLTKIMGDRVEFPSDGPAVFPKTKSTVNFPPELVTKWFNNITYRNGEGDIWAEGIPRAADALGLEDQVWKTHKHGYGPHWDGRYLQFIHSPVWIVSAMFWAMACRDPNVDHAYAARYQSCVKEWYPDGNSSWGTPPIPYADWVNAGSIIYGAPNANAGWDNPSLLYEDKEYTTIWHENERMVKNSGPYCDKFYPCIYDALAPPYVGYINAEPDLYNAVVGTEWTHSDLFNAAERAFNVKRAIWVRQGRSRVHDESVIPYFEQPDNYPDELPPQTVEANKFLDLMDRYYELRGWDKANGWPTRTRLESLGLKDIADELESLGKLP